MTLKGLQGGRFHVYYGYPGYDITLPPYAYLDRDSTGGYGPETITIGRLQSGGVYRYSVHDYSNAISTSSQALAQSNARVEVYNSSELVATFTVPNQEGTLWTVLEIDEAGRIIPVNQTSYMADSSNIRSIGSASRSLAFRTMPKTTSPVPVITDYWQILIQPDKK